MSRKMFKDLTKSFIVAFNYLNDEGIDSRQFKNAYNKSLALFNKLERKIPTDLHKFIMVIFDEIDKYIETNEGELYISLENLVDAFDYMSRIK